MPAPDTGSYMACASITRTELTHRVLALCAETDAITRTWVTNGEHPGRWVPRFRNDQPGVSGPRQDLVWSLSMLQAAGYVCWFNDRNATGTQYAEETPAGRELLDRWDTELLGAPEPVIPVDCLDDAEHADGAA
jgi:hypothetical protein